MKGSLQLNIVNVQPLSKCTPCTQISRLTALGEVYAVVFRTYCAACIGWYFTYFRTVTSTVMGVTKVFLIFNHSLQNHTGIITKTTHMLCFMHWPCNYESYFVAFMFDTSVWCTCCKILYKVQIDAFTVVFSHAVLLGHTPGSVEAQHTVSGHFIGLWEFPRLTVKLLPPVFASFLKKCLSPTETVRAATVWIHFFIQHLRRRNWVYWISWRHLRHSLVCSGWVTSFYVIAEMSGVVPCLEHEMWSKNDKAGFIPCR